MKSNKKANLQRARKEKIEDDTSRRDALARMHEYGFRSWVNADCLAYRKWIMEGRPMDSNGKPILTGR